MLYKRNIEEAVRRNRMLWCGGSSKSILAKIEIEGHSVLDVWVEALSPGICPDPAKMLDHFIANFRFRADLKDDAIPTARPSFGSSVYGAFFGAEVHYGRSGPYAKPLLKGIADFRTLRYNFGSGWLARQIEATQYFARRSDGFCGVSIVETMDNLNLAENLCGSGVYLELVDNPAELMSFFEMALDFNAELVRRQREHISRYQDGYFDIHEIWVPGDTVWLSIDAWNLVDPSTFRRLGFPAIQRSIDVFGSGWLHMHAQGLHLLHDIMRLRGLVGIGLLDDPTEPRCFPRLEEIQRVTKEVPLQINCTREELLEGIQSKTLPKNVMYWVDRGVATVEDANQIMEIVKNY